MKLRNLDPVNPVPLGGWHVRDSGLRRFTFPAGAVVAPGGTVTVDVGAGGAACSAGSGQPGVRERERRRRAMGDGAYLFDPLGNVRASMVYPCRRACSDPAEGAVAVTVDPTGRRESITLENLTARPLDLNGYVLKSPPLQLRARRRRAPAAGRRAADRDRRRPVRRPAARAQLGLRAADPAQRRRRGAARHVHRHHARVHRLGRQDLLTTR